MAAISLGDFAEALDQIEKIPGVQIEDKSTSRTKKYLLKADDRMALASKVNEIFDKKRLKYVSKTISGSSFPSTVITPKRSESKAGSNTIQTRKEESSRRKDYPDARESINVCF